MNLTEKEKKIIELVQGDIPLSAHPFKNMEMRSGITEDEIIETLKNLMKKGIIRKFGAVLHHQRAGYKNNAMIVWAVPDDICEATGKTLSSFPEVTHCYERIPALEGKYNLFTMIHLQGTDLDDFIKKLSDAVKILDFKILRSEEEFKKISMEYFKNGHHI